MYILSYMYGIIISFLILIHVFVPQYTLHPMFLQLAITITGPTDHLRNAEG
jgi:hypothetical protein